MRRDRAPAAHRDLHGVREREVGDHGGVRGHVEAIESPDRVTGDLISRMRARVDERAEAMGAFRTDQFFNTDMVEGYLPLGEELLDQVGGPSMPGAATSARPAATWGGSGAPPGQPELLRVVVEPRESAVIGGGVPGTHRIEGGGVGFIPPQLHVGDHDRVIAVSTEEVMQQAREATAWLGLFSGPRRGRTSSLPDGWPRSWGQGGSWRPSRSTAA